MSENKEININNQEEKTTKGQDFIRTIINNHIETNEYNGRVVTRFPPEPNGYLHIGHAKAICLNFGIANEYSGAKCHLRMDDTDPAKENIEYVNSITTDVKWLGFDWGDNLYYASSYFDELYNYALKLIKMGKAYVCSLTDEEIKEYRGTVTEPGKSSPYRNRSINENLDLFERMRNGEFKDGDHVLRAKIDMSNPNMKMRDPLLYRIRNLEHYKTKDKWCIYPMYDFAHCLSDYIEKITHSICTLEFENNRELYDWILDELELEKPRPYQYEFARLNLNYTVMSKRKLLELVNNKVVEGWDDPRMPTISGLRRRGYTPESIRNFCNSIGVAKSNSTVDISQLEFFIRDNLNTTVPRVMAVLNPLKVTITNYPDNNPEILDAPYYPHDVPLEGSRALPFFKEIYIEKDDFMEKPPKRYHRLSPGTEVRLRHAYVIKCNDVIKDKSGEVIELKCTYDPETKSGANSSSKKVKGTIHWVDANMSIKTEVRLYDRLFNHQNPEEINYETNPKSLEIIKDAFIEKSILDFPAGSRFQFERQGYFYIEPESSKPGQLIFNKIVHLKDSWTKIADSEKKNNTTIKKTESKKKSVKSSETLQKVSEISPELQIEVNKIVEKYNLLQDEAILLGKDSSLLAFFESSVSVYNNPKAISNWIVNELLAELKESSIDELSVSAENIANLIKLIDEKTISRKIAKEIFAHLIKEGGDPLQIVKDRGLEQITDVSQFESIIIEIINNNPENVEKYKNGRNNLLGFFVGQVMKKTGGKADPNAISDLVKSKLEC